MVLDNFTQWLVANTHYLEMIQLLKQKDDSRTYENWTCIGSHDQFSALQIYRINLDTKIQIKYIDTKNQLADILTKGNFTRDEWNHLLTFCFNISQFSSKVCAAAMAKRAQQESGEERVTAKSRPMMNLTARTPSAVASSASTNPGRTSYGYQDPERSVPSDDRTVKPVQPSQPRLYARGLWSILVFSRVEKWNCSARSIGET